MTDWPELRINVARLLRADLRRQAPPDGLPVKATVEASGLGISTARVPDGSPIAVEGVVEAALSSVELDATITTRWQGDCRRCLDPINGELRIEVRSSFVALDDEIDPDVDTYPIDGDWIDVGEVVRDELMLALPLSPLCAETCRGADPERFPPTPNGTSADVDVDPRWDVLSQVTFDED